MIFYVHKVENFNSRTLRYFIFMKWTRELHNIFCPRSGKFNWRDIRYFMSIKWKSLAGQIYDISCPQSGKVLAGEL